MKRYEQFPHTADIGIRVFGKDIPELFENAAFALFDTIGDLEGLKGEIKETVEVKAENFEDLLIAWLDELLYRFCTKEILFYSFDIESLSPTSLTATALGRSIRANRNRLKTEIKAATYHDVKIRKSADGYEVEIILDV